MLTHESRQFPSWLIFDVGQKMKIAVAFLTIAAVIAPSMAQERSLPLLDFSVSDAVYPKAAQREEPKVVFAPPVVYPIELHSRVAGEVLVCVKVDKFGRPARLAVQSSTQEVFARYAIANAMQTKWMVDPTKKAVLEGWFVRKIVFVRSE